MNWDKVVGCLCYAMGRGLEIMDWPGAHKAGQRIEAIKQAIDAMADEVNEHQDEAGTRLVDATIALVDAVDHLHECDDFGVDQSIVFGKATERTRLAALDAIRALPEPQQKQLLADFKRQTGVEIDIRPVWQAGEGGAKP